MKSILSCLLFCFITVQFLHAQNNFEYRNTSYKKQINDENELDFEAEVVCMGEYTQFHLKNIDRVDSVHWKFNDPNSNEAYSSELEPSYIFSCSGRFEVEAEMYVSDSPDMLKIKKEVIVRDLPRAELPRDTILCQEDSVTLIAKHGKLFSYVWNNGSTTDRITVSKDGIYNVTSSNECGSRQEFIVVKNGVCNCQYYLPNTFTPNGDYINDNFKGVYNCDIRQFHIEIFDRWGKLMYESTDPNFNWDGASTNYDGNAVYVYFISMKIKEEEVFRKKSLKGTITMLP